MKKTKPQKILVGGILSFSLLLTSLPGHAGAPSPSTGNSGGSSPTPQMYRASDASSSSGNKPESTATGKPNETASDLEIRSVAINQSQPTGSGADAQMSRPTSNVSWNTEPPVETITEEGTLPSEEVESNSASAFTYLSFDCLKPFEAHELGVACGQNENCSYSISQRDELGNSYFFMKLPIGASQCKIDLGGVVVSVIGDSTEEDPKVLCDYTKAVCQE